MSVFPVSVLSRLRKVNKRPGFLSGLGDDNIQEARQSRIICGDF